MTATALHASALPSAFHSCSTVSTESRKHRHLYQSQIHSAAQQMKSNKHIKPMAIPLNLLSALAVSSTRDVSRSPHRACSISLADSADKEDIGGVGRRDELKLAASSRRVSFISALRREKGWEMMLSSFVRSSSRDGMEELRRMRDCSKSLGMVTLDRRESSGMEKVGMEMSIPINDVAR